jgi:hypothetical protein
VSISNGGAAAKMSTGKKSAARKKNVNTSKDASTVTDAKSAKSEDDASDSAAKVGDEDASQMETGYKSAQAQIDYLEGQIKEKKEFIASLEKSQEEAAYDYRQKMYQVIHEQAGLHGSNPLDDFKDMGDFPDPYDDLQTVLDGGPYGRALREMNEAKTNLDAGAAIIRNQQNELKELELDLREAKGEINRDLPKKKM